MLNSCFEPTMLCFFFRLIRALQRLLFLTSSNYSTGLGQALEILVSFRVSELLGSCIFHVKPNVTCCCATLLRSSAAVLRQNAGLQQA